MFWHTVWSAREHDSEIDLGDVGCSIAALCVEVLVSDVVVVGVSLDGPPQFQTAMRGSVPSCFDVFRGVIVVSCEEAQTIAQSCPPSLGEKVPHWSFGSLMSIAGDGWRSTCGSKQTLQVWCNNQHERI